MGVIVFGSLNMDLVARTPRLLQAGETVLGTEFFTTPGGKGANQAVALAKLGVSTQMVGRVGADAFGQELLESLRSTCIQTESILVDPTTHSGVAIITVAPDGENQIVGIFGANGNVDETDVQRMQQHFPADALLLQLEVPLVAVQVAAQVAHAVGIPVILDPAPVPSARLNDLYPFVDILIPNEVEASQLVGFSVHDPKTAEQAARVLQQQGAKTVIVKLGAQGALGITLTDTCFVPAFAVPAIDTVAAGDAFAGGLVAALIEGASLQQAMVWGAAAGALATTKVGAQAAMPDRATFDAFLQNHGLSLSIRETTWNE